MFANVEPILLIETLKLSKTPPSVFENVRVPLSKVIESIEVLALKTPKISVAKIFPLTKETFIFETSPLIFAKLK